MNLDYIYVNETLKAYINYILSVPPEFAGVEVYHQKETVAPTGTYISFSYVGLDYPPQNTTLVNADCFKYSNILATFSVVSDYQNKREVMELSTRINKYFHRVKNEAYKIAYSRLAPTPNGGANSNSEQVYSLATQANMIIIN